MPPKETQYPSLSIPVTKQERKQAGVERDYVDDYIQAQTIQYNNEYNRSLWQEQMAYNTPSAQRARLEEAGLNPNFNRVDSGNIGTLPTSSGSIRSNVVGNQTARTNTALSAANMLLKSIQDGVESYSHITGGTMDINGYRDYLKSIMKSNMTASSAKASNEQYKAVNSAIDAIWNSYFKGGSSTYFSTQDKKTLLPLGGLEMYDETGNPYVMEIAPQNSLATKLQQGLQALRTLQGKNLTAQEEKIIAETIGIGYKNDIAEKDAQVRTLTNLSPIARTIIESILSLVSILRK